MKKTVLILRQFFVYKYIFYKFSTDFSSNYLTFYIFYIITILYSILCIILFDFLYNIYNYMFFIITLANY
mgnify:CR=1 FL=1